MATMTQNRKNTGYYRLYEQRRRQEGPHKKRVTGKILRKIMRTEAARIVVDKKNKWKTIIQNASLYRENSV